MKYDKLMLITGVTVPVLALFFFTYTTIPTLVDYCIWGAGVLWLAVSWFSIWRLHDAA